jgi:hypothetical protein
LFLYGQDLGQGHTRQDEGDLGLVQKTEEGQSHHREEGKLKNKLFQFQENNRISVLAYVYVLN